MHFGLRDYISMWKIRVTLFLRISKEAFLWKKKSILKPFTLERSYSVFLPRSRPSARQVWSTQHFLLHLRLQPTHGTRYQAHAEDAPEPPRAPLKPPARRFTNTLTGGASLPYGPISRWGWQSWEPNPKAQSATGTGYQVSKPPSVSHL